MDDNRRNNRFYYLFNVSMKEKVLIVKCSMSDPKGILIPRGVIEQLTIEIGDQVAVFRFRDGRTTKRFGELAMKLEAKRGAKDTLYLERIGKVLTKYEGKTKEEIRDIILNQLKEFGVNLKNGR